MSEPLKEYNLLVTRPKHQSDELCRLVEQQGWNAIRFPTIEIVAIESKRIRQQFESMKQYQWVIFISANAVNFALRANSGKIEQFGNNSIVAVGKATEKALHSAGLTVSLVPEIHFNSEGLLATEEMNNVQDKSCLIIRGKGGREILGNTLQERGAKVDYMEVYAREKPICNNSKVSGLLALGKLDAITITSGHALINLMAMISEELHNKLVSVPLIVISNRIKELAEQIGFKHIAVTERPDDTAIIKAAVMMKALFTGAQ